MHNEIEAIRINNSTNITKAVYEMLKLWATEREEEQLKDELISALNNCDMGQIANSIEYN